MKTYQITAPDGTKYEVQAPDGATQDEVLARVQAQHVTEQPQPSFGDELKRQAGLTGRYIAEGVTGLPQVVGNAANQLVNYGISGINALGGNLPYLPSVTSLVQRGLSGLPQPQNPTERVVGDVSRGLAGAATTMGAGGAMQAIPELQGIGNILQANPLMQAASVASGAGAGGITREMGGSPVQQIAASLAGSIAPSAATAATQGLVRTLARGRNTQQMQANIKDFQKAGTTPSVGQATGNRRTQAVESLLSRSPGGAGVMTNKARTQAEEVGNRLDELAGKLSAKGDPTAAGLAIKGGFNQFIQSYKNKSSQLWNAVDDAIGGSTPVQPSSTLSRINMLTRPIPGAPSLSGGVLKSNYLTAIKDQISADSQNGFIPYEALSRLRSDVGRLIDSDALMGDPANGQLKALYGALSEDMKGAASKAGALNLWKNANSYTRAAHVRTDDILQPLINRNIPEKIYQAAVSSDLKLGATKINSIMRSIQPEQRKVVASTFIENLGKAAPGQQNATGENWSFSTFLTNWNKVSDGAKKALFDRVGGSSYRNDLNAVSRVAENIREGSKVFTNPSGTSQALTLQVSAGGSLAALVLGQPMLAAGIAGGIAGANGAARLMTNPSFVSWLAQTTKMSTASLPSAVNSLMAVRDGAPDDQKPLLNAYLDELSAPLLKDTYKSGLTNLLAPKNESGIFGAQRAIQR